MDYVGHVIRPPSEATSIILQVTVGCSHNKCTFCGAYKDVRFHFKDQKIIDQDLELARLHCQRQTTLFLADGDVLITPQTRLVPLLEKIRRQLPWVKRIRLYGNCKSIRSKSLAELEELKSLGLDRIYMGLESGLDQTLTAINKGSDSAAMVAAARKVNQADIFLSATVLLGIAGTDHSQEHASATAEVLNAMSPRQIAALTVMPIPGTPLYDEISKGTFSLPGQFDILAELRTMINGITLTKTQFQANHASNYLPINCRLTRDKDLVISRIDQALAGNLPLMPEFMRAL